jgi:hypothetical protein
MKRLLQIVQVHNRNLLRGPYPVTQLDIRRATQRIADQAGSRRATRRALQFKPSVAINFCADDSAIGAGIQQKCGGITVYFAFYDNQRLHGAEGNSDRTGMRGIGQRYQEKEQQSQCARPSPMTLRVQSRRRTVPVCVQNGVARGSAGRKRAITKCAQIKLSRHGRRYGLQTSSSLYDVRTLWQPDKVNLSVCCFRIFRRAAFITPAYRRCDELPVTDFPYGPGRCSCLAGPAAAGASGPRGKIKGRAREKRKQMD